jgi:hypothetical protein
MTTQIIEDEDLKKIVTNKKNFGEKDAFESRIYSFFLKIYFFLVF